jgi:hypothetical protein
MLVDKIIEQLVTDLQTQLGTGSSYTDYLVELVKANQVEKTDPKITIGIIPIESVNQEREISKIYPTAWVDRIQFQIMVTHVDETSMKEIRTTIIKRFCQQISSDPIKAALLALTDSFGTGTETLMDLNIDRVRYDSTQENNYFWGIAAIDMSFTTDVT